MEKEIKTLHDAVIVAIGRSPVTRARKGGLAQTHPVELGAQVLTGTLKKLPQLDVHDIGDVIVGCAMPFEDQGYNIARLIVERAGLPDSVPGLTINRFCSSGLQSIALCANAIMAGQEDIMIAGGIECMSAVKMGLDPKTFDPWLTENKEGAYMSMGDTAENVAAKYGITREQMDAAAVDSHKKAADAREKELLNEINKLNIGPGGLGGKVTALGVNIETYPTHIAGLPVAVNMCCHVNRHKKRVI